MLSSATLFVHSDSTKEIVIACDVSPYGIDTVISHIIEKLIAYTFHALTAAEKKNNARIDKEGLTVVNGIKKFHQILHCQHFTIVPDHKPLIGRLGETKAIPPSASRRIQRWALTLSVYEYALRYRKGRNLSNAEAHSRIPLNGTFSTPAPIPVEITWLISQLDTSPMDAKCTCRDSMMSRVLTFVQLG